jgi:hypothetical protein
MIFFRIPDLFDNDLKTPESIRSEKNASLHSTFHVGSGIKKSYGSGMRKWSDPGSRHPGSATLDQAHTVIRYSNPFLIFKIARRIATIIQMKGAHGLKQAFLICTKSRRQILIPSPRIFANRCHATKF